MPSEVARLHPIRPLDARGRPGPEPLWRDVLGERLRTLRRLRRRTLSQTAERAGISPQYLSEIERGRKEPSSEMIAAVTGALGVDLADLLVGIAGAVRQRHGVDLAIRQRHAVSRVIGPRPAGPVLMVA